jgi:hypothetical protein
MANIANFLILKANQLSNGIITVFREIETTHTTKKIANPKSITMHTLLRKRKKLNLNNQICKSLQFSKKECVKFWNEGLEIRNSKAESYWEIITKLINMQLL